MNSRERILTTLRHREPDRVPIQDSPWPSAIHRWQKEGLSAEIPVDEYFGFEMVLINADLTPRFPVQVIRRTEEFIVETTSYGGVRRNFRDLSTTPEVVEWPVKSRSDWDQIKERLAPEVTRVDWVTGLANFQRAEADGKFTAFSAGIGYDHFQNFIKSEQLLMLLVSDPGWAREMFETHARLTIAMAEMMMNKGFAFDGAFLFDDMGYRNSSLFSPKTYREVLFESHKMINDFFRARGMPIILHSCGRVKGLIPDLIRAGFDCLQPLEVKAGMDLVELKPEFGEKMAFMGGIDVRLMADPDPSLIEEEIRRKFEAAKPGGGYIYHSDHSVPKNVSFEQYKRTIDLVRKYGEY
jgi:uroporphyrinogen decarboxylase